MVDFSKTGVEGISTSLGSPAPVVDTSGIIQSQSTANTISSVATGVSELFKMYNTTKSASVVNRFAQDQLKLAQAVDQGLISSKEARMRARANFASVAASNPTILGELSKTHASILETSGLGKVIASGTEEEQRLSKQYDKASQEGFIVAGEDPSEGLQNWLEHTQTLEKGKAIKNEQEILKNKLDIEGKLTSNETSKLQQNQLRLKIEAQKNLKNLARTGHIQLANKLKQLQQDVEQNKISREDAIKAANNFMYTIESTSSQVGVEAGGDFSSSLLKPMQDLKENYLKFFSGEISKDVLDNQNSIAIGRQTAIALSDSRYANVAALSKLLGGENLVLMPMVNDLALEFINNGLKKGKFDPNTGGDPELKDAEKTYLNLLKGVIKDPNAKKDTLQEVQTHLDSIMKGISSSGGRIEDTKDLNVVVDFFSSGEFGKYTSLKGGIPSEYAQDAASTLENFWTNEAYNVIQDEYKKAQVRQGRGFDTHRVDASTVIEPTFNGTGVVFKPSKGTQRVATGVDPRVTYLNKKVAPLINKIIRMNAHLNGNTDYKQSWDRLSPEIFPEYFGDNNNTADQPVKAPKQ